MLEYNKMATYKTSVQCGKSFGISFNPCLLQSTRVPRQEHLLGQAFAWAPDSEGTVMSTKVMKHHTLILIPAANCSCNVFLGQRPILFKIVNNCFASSACSDEGKAPQFH